MPSSYDEHHWYGPLGWRTLRKRVLRVFHTQAEELFDSLKSRAVSAEDTVTAFVAGVADTIGGYADQAIRAQLAVGDEGVYPSSMWAFALPLFGDSAPLVKALVAEVHVMRAEADEDVDPHRALSTIVRQFLEDARLNLGPESAQRRKNWETMDRVSLEIARLNVGNRLSDRCSDEHLMVVRAALKERYPTNKNVNVSLGTLRAYFDEFCPESEYVSAEDADSELLALGEETGIWPTIDRCVEALKNSDFSLWEALAVKTQTFDDVAVETQANFLSRVGLSRHAFEQRCRAAGDRVRECCENSVEFLLLDLKRQMDPRRRG